MNHKERQRGKAADVMILIGMLALLSVICRLWPILLLMILGIFVAALRVLCNRPEKVEVLTPVPYLPEPKPSPTIKDLEQIAYSVMQARITELVAQDYPEARWVFETPEAMQEIMVGGEVFILLNRAGGYRRAGVLYQNLQAVGIDYHPDRKPESVSLNPWKEGRNGETESISLGQAQEDFMEEPMENNYELLAFEWSEAHILELNERCNEAIGQGKNEILIPLEELPAPESWQDICRELERAGLARVKIVTDGIIIIL